MPARAGTAGSAEQIAPEHAGTVVTEFAHALRQLHAQPITDCPFDQRMHATQHLPNALPKLSFYAGSVRIGSLIAKRTCYGAIELCQNSIRLRPTRPGSWRLLLLRPERALAMIEATRSGGVRIG